MAGCNPPPVIQHGWEIRGNPPSMGIAMGKSWKIIRPNGFFSANHGNEFSMESISNEIFHGIYI
jgi:hypothetical protein